MTDQLDQPDDGASPIAHLLDELQLYGHRPFDDAPDPRPLPEDRLVRGAVADIFDALIVALGDTRMEPDLDDILWAQVNLFHRAETRFERLLDDNEQAQKRLQREQDGSEVKSVELERLIAQGISLIERRNDEIFAALTAAERRQLGALLDKVAPDHG